MPDHNVNSHEIKIGMPAKFVRELADLINQHSLENQTGEPDFVTAEFLTATLEVYIVARQRAKIHKGG